MDERRFDSLARLLGQAANRREGVKAALGGLLGVGAGAAALDAFAKNKDKGKGRDARAEDADDAGDDAEADKHKQCSSKRPCAAGWACVKSSKKKKHHGKKRRVRSCVCQSGVTCGVACCASGQSCVDGVCTGDPDPDPGTCIAKGEACKNSGRRCCAGLSCSSGQGGERDIACYVSKRGACTATSDCIFGTTCQDGICQGPVPLGQRCELGDVCVDGACRVYDSGDPAGTYCLKLTGEGTCTANAQCVAQVCTSGICGSGGGGGGGKVETSIACGDSNGGAECLNTLGYDVCTTYATGDPEGTYCLRQGGEPCDKNLDCESRSCVTQGSGKVCAAWTTEACGASANNLPCANSLDECVAYDSGTPTGTYCLRQPGEICSIDADCQTSLCDPTAKICLRPAPAGAVPCTVNGAPCAGTKQCISYDPLAYVGTGTYCLYPDNTTLASPSGCTTNDECASFRCATTTSGGSSGYCAPVACNVYLPVGNTTNAAGTWSNLQDASNALKTRPGTTTMKDIGIYGGTYSGKTLFADDSWNVFSCAGTPILTATASDYTLIELDVNAAPEKFVKLKGLTLTGNPVEAFKVYGGAPNYMNLTLEDITTTFTATAGSTLQMEDTVKLTVLNSTLSNMPINSNPASRINYITLSGTTTHVRGNSTGTAPGVLARNGTTHVEIKDSVQIKDWTTSAAGAGIRFDNDADGSLTLGGTVSITDNQTTAANNPGSGIQLPATGVPVTTASASNVYAYATGNPTGTGTSTDADKQKNCQQGLTFCPATNGGF